MEAIHGVRFTGFIGELYQRYPFPEEPEAFRQKPEGYRNQTLVRDLISSYADQIMIPVGADKEALVIDIGAYKFSRQVFQELVTYVWQGGYPRWKDCIRPDYVLDMKAKIESHPQWLFENIQLN